MLGGGPVGSFPVGAGVGSSNFFSPAVGGIVFHGSNVLANQLTPRPGPLTFLGVLPSVVVLASPRVSWIGAEALHTGASKGRVSWSGVEALHTGASKGRVSWSGVEALHVGASSGRVSWIGLEILRSTAAIPTLVVVSWIGAEALHTGASKGRVSWTGVEVLRSVNDTVPDKGFVYLIC